MQLRRFGAARPGTEETGVATRRNARCAGETSRRTEPGGGRSAAGAQTRPTVKRRPAIVPFGLRWPGCGALGNADYSKSTARLTDSPTRVRKRMK